MRNILLFIIAIFIDIADVEAAVRSADTINRQQQTLNDTGSTVVARTTIARNNTTSIPLSQQVTNRTPTASSRDGTGNTVNRSATVTNASARNTAQTSTTARTASNTIARSTRNNDNEHIWYRL